MSCDASSFYYCPFKQRGYCRNTTNCTFSHDYSNSIQIPINYCHFYLANQCLYGSDCKFLHAKPPALLQPAPPRSSTPPSELDRPPIWTSSTTSSFKSPLIATSSTPTSHLDQATASTSYHISSESLDYPYCDLCGQIFSSSSSSEELYQHRDECLSEHEREMELSFAIQRSRDKVCGICMDLVMEKRPITSSRFGILEKCNHIFCLDCIRTWRGTKQFETRTTRSCPECRVSSDFVVPSKYWVEDQDDKDRLITDYKTALKSKPCKYFNEGKGECPFAGSCFYKHAYQDGRIAKLPAPRPRRRFVSSGYPAAAITNYILWNIITSTGDDDLSNDDDDDDDDDIEDDEDLSDYEVESLYYEQDRSDSDNDNEDDDDHR